MAKAVRLKIGFNPGSLSEEAARQVRDIFADEMLEAAAELQSRSPVGATGELQNAWDVMTPRRSPATFEIRGFVTNTAPNAIHRIVGRPPGTMPPIAPIKDWLAAKGRDPKQAWAVARSIAKRGTQRWRDKTNFAGITPTGKVTPDSPITHAEQRIAERVAKLNLLKRRK